MNDRQHRGTQLQHRLQIAVLLTLLAATILLENQKIIVVMKIRTLASEQ